MPSDVPHYPLGVDKRPEHSQFYRRWLDSWNEGVAIDIHDEYGYLFDYIHGLIGAAGSSADMEFITSELSTLRKSYPINGHRKAASFHGYALSYTADAQVVMKQYQAAIQTLSTSYELFLWAHVDKVLSLKLHIGEDISGGDLLFHGGVPRLTDWGRNNLTAVVLSADEYLQDKRRELNSTILPVWVKELETTLRNWKPVWKTYPIFSGRSNRFETSIPYHYFVFIRPFGLSVKVLAPILEDAARVEQAFPRIGEGWIGETELYYAIKKALPNLDVEQHASPPWLGKQHLDIYIPSRRTAVEFQGAQHDRPIEFFGGEEAHVRTTQRDARKMELCAQNGVRLLYVRPAYSLEMVIRQINEAS
jgi:hypothetical protein